MQVYRFERRQRHTRRFAFCFQSGRIRQNLVYEGCMALVIIPKYLNGFNGGNQAQQQGERGTPMTFIQSSDPFSSHVFRCQVDNDFDASCQVPVGQRSHVSRCEIASNKISIFVFFRLGKHSLDLFGKFWCIQKSIDEG